MSKIKILSFNFEKNKFKIKYNGLEFPLEEKIDEIIFTENDIFEFVLICDTISKNFKVELSKDFLNQIIIDLEGNLEEQKYDIELINIITDKIKLPTKKTFKNKENLFISKKRKDDNTYEFVCKREEEIPFEIDIKDIKGSNLRFCLHQLNNNIIMTIHDMSKEIKDNYQFQVISLNDLDLLKNKILSNIKKIKDEISKSNIKNINYQIIDSKYNNDIIYYNLLNLEFEENHFLTFIDYSYKYLCNNMKNVIDKIITNFDSKIENNYEFIKSIILEILTKFECFNEYVNYFLNNKSELKNLIIPKLDLSFREKAKILSSVLTIILNSPSFKSNQKIEFFNFKEKGNKNVYLDAHNFLLGIINKLKVNSALNKGYSKTFSRIKLDINKKNIKYYSKHDNRKVFIIELMNLEELKCKLISYLPDLVVRYCNSKSNIAAQYDIFSENILINEIIFTEKKNNFLSINDDELSSKLEPMIKGSINLLKEENQQLYNLFVFRAFWRLNHEGLGHKPISKISHGKNDTPTKTIMDKDYTKTKDAGKIIEFYIYQDADRIDWFDCLKICKFDPKKLLNEELYIQNSFNEFWTTFEDIEIQQSLPEDEELEGETKLYDKIANLFIRDKDDLHIISHNCKFNIKNPKNALFQRAKI